MADCIVDPKATQQLRPLTSIVFRATQRKKGKEMRAGCIYETQSSVIQAVWVLRGLWSVWVQYGH